MKKTAEWVFVGYGIQTDLKEDGLCYSIVYPAEGETLEEAVQRAKEKAEEGYERRRKEVEG